MYAERLTELAASLGFDGWLINMEGNLDARQIPYLKEFVVHLSQTMHSAVPGSLVIWYDSVTINGDLNWQDQLNDKNKPFFDLFDGIFVNYTWQEDYPKLSAAIAGDKKSFWFNTMISSTASSGYTLKDEIDPSNYSFTTALRALQARSGYVWECSSPDGFALNSKWNDAERYICNPLLGEVPIECLSVKTSSGRSFNSLVTHRTFEFFKQSLP